MHILIVDDDYAIRDALAEMLEDEGHVVGLAANGQEALAYLQHAMEHPDLILLDLAMPVMSGWEFRTIQQQDQLLATIPVVVLSADRSVQQKAETISADAYVAKPVLIDTLLEVIDRFAV